MKWNKKWYDNQFLLTLWILCYQISYMILECDRTICSYFSSFRFFFFFFILAYVFSKMMIMIIIMLLRCIIGREKYIDKNVYLCASKKIMICFFFFHQISYYFLFCCFFLLIFWTTKNVAKNIILFQFAHSL